MRSASGRLLMSAALLLLQSGLTINTPAQEAAPKCPQLTVQCPTSCWKLGDIVEVSAQLQNSESYRDVTYNWSVSAGRIRRGQGTASIGIDTTALGGQTVTATVDVGGIPDCPAVASCSLTICEYPPPDVLVGAFDKYGLLSFREEKLHLNNLADQLQVEPDRKAYIIVYEGEDSGPREVLRHVKRAWRYLTIQRRIEAKRILFADGGKQQRMGFEMHLLPSYILPDTYPLIRVDKEPVTAGRRRAKRKRF